MTEASRTYDFGLVTEIIKELWPYLVDDSPLDPEDFEPRMDEDSRWYTSTEDGEIVAVYWLRKLNHITWEIHTNVLPRYWGTGIALRHAKHTLPIIFDESGASRIVAIIPESAPQVLRYAEAVGFQREGRMRKSHQKNGVVGDQIYLGISKDNIK